MSTLTMKTLAMKKTLNDLKKLSMVAAVALVLTACASTPKTPEGAVAVRSKLSQLQSDPQLASRAPVAINDAEQAVRAAEKPTQDKALSKHLIWIADRKVQTAVAQAEARLAEDQFKSIGEQRASARLESRTAEVDQARSEAELAKQQAEAAKQQAEELQRQIKELNELNAKETDRGLVVTLGDVLFEVGRAELKNNSLNNLAKLATFLNKYEDRSVIIEGHTDSTGAEDYNLGLSQRRADSVKSFLLNQGVAANRIVATGKGEGSPVAGNDSAGGRQMNRRVEVIIANPATATK